VSFTSVDATRAALAGVGYVADAEIATALYLAARLQKPLLVEGPAGVGKTELAKSAARASGRPLFRVQCYEGLDEAKLLYEWKYAKQLLYTQMLRDQITEVVGGAADLGEAIERIAAHEDAFFSERFLEPRALLAAIRSPDPAVLLIDEVDRAEEELEAFFLEVLAELQVTIPELGTIRATSPPLIVLTSNATRELSDALRRRCLYLWIDYPPFDKELRIVERKVPGINARLAAEVARFMESLRRVRLSKVPGVAETLDWAQALATLHAEHLDEEVVAETLGCILKDADDIKRFRAEVGKSGLAPFLQVPS
jgi:MoxR-like ATPase